MESATIAANGYRFRVPYGTLLCVSDKPMHGHLKLPGMADRFYRERVDQHLQIGLKSLDILRQSGLQSLHSRKLRSFASPAFRCWISDEESSLLLGRPRAAGFDSRPCRRSRHGGL